MALIRPRTNALFVRKVEALTKDLGRRHSVIVVTKTKAVCPNCFHDEVSHTSTGEYNGTGPQPFQTKVCPVCDNAGFTFTERQTTLVAPVQFPGQPREDKAGAGGDLKQDQVKLKTFIKHKALLERASHFIIDGLRFVRDGNTRDRGLLTKVTTWMVLKRED